MTCLRHGMLCWKGSAYRMSTKCPLIKTWLAQLQLYVCCISNTHDLYVIWHARRKNTSAAVASQVQCPSIPSHQHGFQIHFYPLSPPRAPFKPQTSVASPKLCLHCTQPSNVPYPSRFLSCLQNTALSENLQERQGTANGSWLAP